MKILVLRRHYKRAFAGKSVFPDRNYPGISHPISSVYEHIVTIPFGIEIIEHDSEHPGIDTQQPPARLLCNLAIGCPTTNDENHTIDESRE
jgi:hypothetical protein